MDEYDYRDFDEPVSDAYVEEAKPELRNFLEEHGQNVFYLKQLQVRFEGKFFHWVTARALYALVEENLVGDEVVLSGRGIRIRLFFSKRHRYRRRRVAGLVRIIDDMSDPVLAEACGEHADVLFFKALMLRGFTAYGEDVREYKGRVWEETEHNLDFIVERDEVAYGCEVKNTWDYIKRDELRVKLRMCEHLGIRPLFIVRSSPKTYNYEVYRAGGFVLVFVAHIYPFGMREFARRVEEELGLPADSPRAIPSGSVDRFMRWHEKHV
jgi:hypothetical protein